MIYHISTILIHNDRVLWLKISCELPKVTLEGLENTTRCAILGQPGSVGVPMETGNVPGPWGLGPGPGPPGPGLVSIALHLWRAGYHLGSPQSDWRPFSSAETPQCAILGTCRNWLWSGLRHFNSFESCRCHLTSTGRLSLRSTAMSVGTRKATAAAWYVVLCSSTVCIRLH